MNNNEIKIGINTKYIFNNELVHKFECYPKEPDIDLFKKSSINHEFNGKLDGTINFPILKNKGLNSLLVSSIIVNK